MDASEGAEPPIDRPTKLRWEHILIALLLAVLVGAITLPIVSRARLIGAATTAGMQASGIFKAIMLYSLDHDGKFPTADDNSNQAFRQLFHWAYVSGLDSSSPGNLPIIADGFIEGQPGTYTDDPSTRGGVWGSWKGKGAGATVVFADGTRKQIPLSEKSGFRVLLPDPATGKPVDIFTREGGLPEGARVLNPE